MHGVMASGSSGRRPRTPRKLAWRWRPADRTGRTLAIRCPFTRKAVLEMLPVFKDGGWIARRVANTAYADCEVQVRKLRA